MIGLDVSRTILEDCGVDRDYGAVMVNFNVMAYDGHDWKPVDLCVTCLAIVIAEAVRVLRQEVPPVESSDAEPT